VFGSGWLVSASRKINLPAGLGALGGSGFVLFACAALSMNKLKMMALLVLSFRPNFRPNFVNVMCELQGWVALPQKTHDT
jgi:hypothetical protein